MMGNLTGSLAIVKPNPLKTYIERTVIHAYNAGYRA